MCLWVPLSVWNFLPQPLQTNTWPMCCQIFCCLWLSHLQKAFPHFLVMFDDEKCTKLSIIKFFSSSISSRVCMMLGLCASLQCDYCRTPDLPNSPVLPLIGKSGRLYIWVVVWLFVCRNAGRNAGYNRLIPL